jgi:hypothetical protein
VTLWFSATSIPIRQINIQLLFRCQCYSGASVLVCHGAAADERSFSAVSAFLTAAFAGDLRSGR